MASKAKKRAVGNGIQRPLGAPGQREEEEEEEDEVEDEEEDEDDSDEEEDEVDEIVDEEVNIEFEAYSISDNDYGGIKKLLQQVQSFQNFPVCLLHLAGGISPFPGEWLLVPFLLVPLLVTVLKFAVPWSVFLCMWTPLSSDLSYNSHPNMVGSKTKIIL
ncbi:BRCA2 and CDKN1A interacting protein, isoform CRA_e [Mus musculus]|nr:BRCA2 and CDKN1A interacting protein, isoform CRA_e [Mus musculus]